MNLDAILYAIKSLRRRRLRSWLTMIGIFIGVASVVSLISLGQGLRNALTEQFADLGTDIIIVQGAGTSFGPPGSTSVRKMSMHDLEIIKKINGVKIAIGRLLRVVKIEFQGQAVFSFIASIPAEGKEMDFVEKVSRMEVEEGRLLSLQSSNQVVLGNEYTSGIFTKRVSIGNKVKINGKEFEIIGFLKKTGSIQGNRVIIMPEKAMRELLGINEDFDLIGLQTEGRSIEDVAQNIKKELQRARNQKKGEEDFTVQTPIQVAQAVDTVLNIVNGIVIGIAAISLLVGGIGIMNTMYTSVLERTKEIGIMKAIGAQRKDVLSIFLIESGMLGFVGGMIGGVIGLGLAKGVEYLSGSFFGRDLFKVEISLPLVFGSVLFSSLIGILSGFSPSWRAMKIPPAHALKK